VFSQPVSEMHKHRAGCHGGGKYVWDSERGASRLPVASRYGIRVEDNHRATGKQTPGCPIGWLDLSDCGCHGGVQKDRRVLGWFVFLGEHSLLQDQALSAQDAEHDANS